MQIAIDCGYAVSISTFVMNQQFPLWKKAVQWENGLGGLGRLKRIFFYPNARISSKKIKKNPFQSAQSVLPLYRHFPKRNG
jgi:hypothetical protein